MAAICCGAGYTYTARAVSSDIARVQLVTIRTMKRLILIILTLVLLLSGWLFVDALLDEETRRWLESPEPFEYDRSRLVQLAAYALPEQSRMDSRSSSVPRVVG